MLGISILTPQRHGQWRISDNQLQLHADNSGLPSELVDELGDLSFEIRRSGQEVELRNFGASLVLHSGPRIHRGGSTSISLPVHLCSGLTQIHLFDPNQAHPLDHSLTELRSSQSSTDMRSLPAFGVAPSAETLASWLDSIAQIQRAASGSDDFFMESASALFNPGGLDGGIVLVPKEAGNYQEWKIKASHIPYPDFGIAFRSDLVQRAAESKTTLFHDSQLLNQTNAEDDLHACVICPVLAPDQSVASIVYGFRSQHRTNNRRGIRILEAQFVQVIADSMSAALARFQSESKAARKQALLEQAFAPTVVWELQNDPSILEGSKQEVTTMFADLRDFSTIAERIGARMTYQMMNAFMDQVTRLIESHEGVVIDYYGDGISAFWNAPVRQPCHPLLACQAGISMLQWLPEFNEIWQARLGQPLRLGIGIHTGTAMVGNSGSSHRLKYGPRGTAVNLTARIESATKQLRTNLLVSGETAAQLDNIFMKRRVCTTLVKGIQKPTELWELFDPNLFYDRQPAFEAYQSALTRYEADDFEAAKSILNALHASYPYNAVVSFLKNHCERRLNLPSDHPLSADPAAELIPLTSRELNLAIPENATSQT